MKRTPLKKQGKVGKANTMARQLIAGTCENLQLNYCEAKLEGCMGNWPLAPAHLHKRSWYKGNVELLADYNQWICACQVCHDQMEHNLELTEELFNHLRP